jgi:hypothetical protein
VRTLSYLLVSYLVASYVAEGWSIFFPAGPTHPHSPDLLLWLVSPVWPVMYVVELVKTALTGKDIMPMLGLYPLVFMGAFLVTAVVLFKIPRRTSNGSLEA